MPVFDFSSIPENEKKQDPVCTYTMFRSNEAAASPEKPILILDNSSEQWKHHAIGVFGNQNKRTNFEFREEGSSAYADILQIDARFVSLVIRFDRRDGSRQRLFLLGSVGYYHYFI